MIQDITSLLLSHESRMENKYMYWKKVYSICKSYTAAYFFSNFWRQSTISRLDTTPQLSPAPKSIVLLIVYSTVSAPKYIVLPTVYATVFDLLHALLMLQILHMLMLFGISIL